LKHDSDLETVKLSILEDLKNHTELTYPHDYVDYIVEKKMTVKEFCKANGIRFLERY